jgi:TRAP transporter TAXI family solute receptor
MKKFALFLLIFAVTILSASEVHAARPLQRLVCGTSGNTGTYYLYAGNWSKVMNAKVEGVDIACEVSGGPTKNLQLMANGDIDLGFTTGWMAGEAYKGTGEFDGAATTVAKAMFPMYSSVMYLYVLEKSDIKSLRDLEGKHVATGTPGGTSDKAARVLLKALGITPSEISSLTGDTGMNAFKEGIVDAAFYVGSAPASYLMNLETTHKFRFIQITDEEYAAIFKAFPYWTKDLVPAQTYKNQTEDFTFISFWNYAVAREDLDADLVYDLVKTTFENQDVFVKTDSNFATTTAANISKISTPLHPGAYRYYKEIGVPVPDNIIPE